MASHFNPKRDGATPATAFGDARVAHMIPVVQIDAVYGLHGDTEEFTGTGGTATASGGEFSCTTGTNVGGYGTIRSIRAARYRPGQGMRARWTARYPVAGVANCLVMSGPFTGLDGIWFGYNGAEFGVMLRQGGAYEIRTLTVSAAATGAETVTITLDGTAYNVSVTSGTVQQNAQEIATGSAFGGLWEVDAVDDTVIFHSLSVSATQTDTYSISSTGDCDGSFARTQVGAVNDTSTHWYPQADWNIDPLLDDATDTFVLDPTKGNVFEATWQYLGYGVIEFHVEHPQSGELIPVHRILYPNAHTIPSMRNPTLRIGWFAASLGSTTDLSVYGASAAMFLEGEKRFYRNPWASVNTDSIAATEEPVLQIRNRRVFQGTTNQGEILPETLTVSLAGNKSAEVRVYLNCTRTGTEAWLYENESESIAEVDKTSGLTVSGGKLVAATALAGGSTVTLDLEKLDIHLKPLDVLTVTGFVTGGAGDNMTVAIDWQED